MCWCNLVKIARLFTTNHPPIGHVASLMFPSSTAATVGASVAADRAATTGPRWPPRPRRRVAGITVSRVRGSLGHTTLFSLQCTPSGVSRGRRRTDREHRRSVLRALCATDRYGDDEWNVEYFGDTDAETETVTYDRLGEGGGGEKQRTRAVRYAIVGTRTCGIGTSIRGGSCFGRVTTDGEAHKTARLFG